jgi:DNA-binding NarL/FixJ family response regulator
VLEPVAAACSQPVTGRALGVMERLLSGQSHKVVAIELQVSVSTVTSSLQGSMRTMGLPCRNSRAPVILTMAALAALRPRAELVLGRIACSGGHENATWVVSVRRVDLELESLLTKAESAALRQLVAGSSYAQIAEQRAVSVRTVANQLAAAFRKLGVSGRSEVVQQLIARSVEFRSTTRATFARTATHLGGLGLVNGSQLGFASAESVDLTCRGIGTGGGTASG